MKNTLIFGLFIIFVSLAQCQNANIITEIEFNNIEINGKKLIDIRNTYGEPNAVEALFGQASEKIIDPDGDFMEFYYGQSSELLDNNDFEIGFSAMLSDDRSKPIISAFIINNDNWNITIRGITLTIGDNINTLGNVTINPNTDGSRSVIYQFCNGCNSFISIRFNKITNKITSIQFIEQT